MTTPAMRPFLCRWGAHRWGLNEPQPRPHHVYWARNCTRPRCRALLYFAAEPFIYGPVDRWRHRRSAL